MNNDDIKKITTRIDALLESNEIVLVAIDGNSASGKSTLASLLERIYDCNIFHMDDFFLQPELKTEERLIEIGGNVDYIRFKEEVINGLIGEKEFTYQIYNCHKQEMDQTIVITPKKLNIVEGAYSLHPTLIENYDLKVFLEISPKEQSRRILERNGEINHKTFLNLWIPKENDYFYIFKIKEKCNLVIDMSNIKK